MPYRWYIFLAAVLRWIYFSSVRVVGALPSETRPRIMVASHRNGAIDGYMVMAAFPDARFLLSAQLLRNGFLRLMFGGIPVVRKKDRERYGMRAADSANPILAGCKQVRTGGGLVMFPEGSSEWGPHPQAYEGGTARMVRMLLDDCIDFEVVPVGLYYRAPDRFRSAVEVLVGAPIALPERGTLDRRAWELKIHEAISTALNDVSPNCPDMTSFERVERLAAEDAANGSSYAVAFKHHERNGANGSLPVSRPARLTPVWRVLCGLPGLVLLAPILLIGARVGRKADGRNTVTFFRMAGGFAAALVWIPAFLVLSLLWPEPMLILLVLAVIGWPAFQR